MAGPRYVRTHSIRNETAEDPSVCPRTLHMSPACSDTKKNLLTKMPLNIHTCSRSSLETFRGDAIQRVGSPHGEAAGERPAGADGGSRAECGHLTYASMSRTSCVRTGQALLMTNSAKISVLSRSRDVFLAPPTCPSLSWGLGSASSLLRAPE